MKLYIPEIGDHLRLTADWTFNLHNEYRNRSLWELYDCENKPEVIDQEAKASDLRAKIEAIMSKWRWPGSFSWHYNDKIARDPADVEKLSQYQDELHKLNLKITTITIPANSLLAVDRIFIRKGMDDWSSLTFFLKEHPAYTFKKKPRFWAKLADCNNIEFEQVKD